MKYPAIGKTASRVVSVPSLSGGINLSDPLNLVDDNQLTDMENLWYKNGTLRTRPAIRAVSNPVFCQSDTDAEVKMYSTGISHFDDGKKYILLVKKEINASNGGIIRVTGIGCDCELGSLNTAVIFSDGKMPESEVFYFAKKTLPTGTGLYMLVTEIGGKNHLYEDTSGGFQLLSGADLYTPTVYINGKCDEYATLSATETTEYAPASFLEGYSALSDAWAKYCYTSDGKSVSLTLPVDLRDSNLEKITASFIDPQTGHEYTFETTTFGNATVFSIDCNENNNYYISVNRLASCIQFFQKKETDPDDIYTAPSFLVIPSGLNGLNNNITIKLKYNVENSILKGMRLGTWFGGSADGISGGTRLFLTGSEENKNLLCWSDVMHPTYFPENNYAYIGEAAQKITALAKQSDMLVIFKENELFYTTYTQGNSYTAKEIVSGAVTDITAQAAIFPMVQIHAEIGCDIPKSIQLCGDRLVWATIDRHVYMLRSADKYSTCNISNISDMCERELAKLSDSDIAKAKACTYNGHYLLAFGSKIFVLNYDYYYFKNLPSYSDSKKAQRKLIWYLWKTTSEPESIVFTDFISFGENCSIVAAYNDKTLSEYRLFSFDTEADCDTDFLFNKRPITSMLQTKLFDFGMMERFKKIEQLYIGFGECAGKANIEYVTDCGRIDRGGFELSGEVDDFSAEYIKIKRFLPCINRALRFGIRLQCEGRIAVDGILIKYKPIGVTR